MLCMHCLCYNQNISVIMKNTRGKENSQAASNQWVSSTYRVESDQKDLIIKALKGDCDNLKKNENQYHRLYDTYKQLQHKYKLLQDEKDNDDRQFKMRHEAAIRNIAQLRNQIDALKAELRDKRLQTGDLQSDEATLKQQYDEKNIELQNFRNDYKSCIADSEELSAEKQSLNNATTKLRGIIGQAQEESRLLKQDNDSVGRRLEELSRYQDQLLLQQKILREKILGYQNQNNELDGTINQYCENLSNLQLGIKKAQDQLTQLQQAIAQLGLLNQKYKTENNLVQKNIQNEVIKNNNFAKNLKNAEYTQKVRIGQVEEANQEVAGLRAENESLQKINQKLAEDLQACRAHLQNLGLVNSKLVQHLENFSREDQEVREVLNRKGRVQFARGRVSQAVSQKTSLSQTRFPSSRLEYR